MSYLDRLIKRNERLFDIWGMVGTLLILPSILLLFDWAFGIKILPFWIIIALIVFSLMGPGAITRLEKMKREKRKAGYIYRVIEKQDVFGDGRPAQSTFHLQRKSGGEWEDFQKGFDTEIEARQEYEKLQEPEKPVVVTNVYVIQ